MKKWEYRTVKLDTELTAEHDDWLNEEGEEGWELVSVYPVVSSMPNKDDVISDISQEENYYIFKRPLIED